MLSRVTRWVAGTSGKVILTPDWTALLSKLKKMPKFTSIIFRYVLLHVQFINADNSITSAFLPQAYAERAREERTHTGVDTDIDCITLYGSQDTVPKICRS